MATLYHINMLQWDLNSGPSSECVLELDTCSRPLSHHGWVKSQLIHLKPRAEIGILKVMLIHPNFPFHLWFIQKLIIEDESFCNTIGVIFK